MHSAATRAPRQATVCPRQLAMARHTASVLARARRAGAGRLAKPPALALLALPLLFPFLMLATTARGGDAKVRAGRNSSETDAAS